MNRLKKLIPLFAFALLTLPAMANTAEETSAEELRQEVAKALDKMDLGNLKFIEETVKVNFIVNEKNQIIVISTNNSSLDNAIKNRLNYKTLKSTAPDANKMYTLPVKVKAK